MSVIRLKQRGHNDSFNGSFVISMELGVKCIFPLPECCCVSLYKAWPQQEWHSLLPSDLLSRKHPDAYIELSVFLVFFKRM
jgi:hypothetical protein